MARKQVEQRRYFRVSPTIWRKQLTDDGRILALYFTTCEHRITEGLYRIPVAYAMTDLGWQSKPSRFQKALEHLLEVRYVQYDHGYECVLLMDALELQAPENPNQVKAAIRRLREDVPAETDLFLDLYVLAERFSEPFAKGLREGFPERFPQGFREPLGDGFGEGLGEPPSPSPSQAQHSSVSRRMSLSAGANADLVDLGDQEDRF